MPKGVPLTEQDQACRQREIGDAAVRLFLEKGFQETSMREISAAVGMGKSTLYDYFKTKDDILLYVLEDKSHQLTRQAQEIAALDLPVARRLHKIIEMHAEFLNANGELFLKLSMETQRLNANSQKRIQLARYEYQNLVQSVIEEGIRDGSFRKVDTLLAARLIINSLISILYTSRPTGNVNEMLGEAMGIFLTGIQAEQCGKPQNT